MEIESDGAATKAAKRAGSNRVQLIWPNRLLQANSEEIWAGGCDDRRVPLLGRVTARSSTPRMRHFSDAPLRKSAPKRCISTEQVAPLRRGGQLPAELCAVLGRKNAKR